MTQTELRAPVEAPRGNRRNRLLVALAAAVAAGIAIWAAAAALQPDEQTAGTAASALTDEQARAIAATYFEGWNEGDYATFSRHFGTDMKAGVTEEAFRQFHVEAFPAIGAYVETTDLNLMAAQTPGHVTWVFTTRFEREDGVEVRLTFPEDGRQISGAHILSTELGTR